MKQKRLSNSGVSLIEVLVTLVIFSVVGLAGASFLNTMLRTSQLSDDRLAVLQQIDRAFDVLDQDTQRMFPETLEVKENEISFLRNTSSNPLLVHYYQKDGALIRELEKDNGERLLQEIIYNSSDYIWAYHNVETEPALELNFNFSLYSGQEVVSAKRLFPIAYHMVTK